MNTKRVLGVIIVAAVVAALIGGVVFWRLSSGTKPTTAIVTNGIECSAITR